MLTVVIPTRNRAELLAAALRSLISQNLEQEKFEIIVVDNGSTDGTQKVVSAHRNMLSNLSCIYAPEPGLHNGRHAGMNSAEGNILVFADDDIEALPTWLSSIEEAFRDPNVVMVGGNNFPQFIEPPPAWLSEMWARPKLLGYRSIPSLSLIEFTRPPIRISPYKIWGCNFSIRKDILIKAGGFHPDGMPKDLVRFRGDGETHVSKYVVESGLKCVFHPGASVYHKVTPERMTYSYFRQRGFNQGVSDSYSQLRESNFECSFKSKFSPKRMIGNIVKGLLGVMESNELKEAHNQFNIGYSEGYLYHQKAYMDDPEVCEWVHRPTYF